MVKRRIYDDDRHAHFVTFSCYKRRRLLDPHRSKRIVIGTLGSQLVKRNGICIGFVVMPDYVHALVWFDKTGQLSLFMDKWKDQSSSRIKDLFRREHADYWEKAGEDDPVWQPRYYGFNVFTEEKIQGKLDYIHLNPVRSGLVDHPCNWLWSSARWYLQGKSVGLPISMPPF